MKNADDFHISVKDHSEAHRLTDKQRNIALDTVTVATATVDKNGEKLISAQIYFDYMLFVMGDLSSTAKKFKSFDDLEQYEFSAREFLHEWSIIIGEMSQSVVNEQRLNSIDESEKTLETFIGKMDRILEHLVDANKLLIEFGRAQKDNPKR